MEDAVNSSSASDPISTPSSATKRSSESGSSSSELDSRQQETRGDDAANEGAKRRCKRSKSTRDSGVTSSLENEDITETKDSGLSLPELVTTSDEGDEGMAASPRTPGTDSGKQSFGETSLNEWELEMESPTGQEDESGRRSEDEDQSLRSLRHRMRQVSNTRRGADKSSQEEENDRQPDEGEELCEEDFIMGRTGIPTPDSLAEELAQERAGTSNHPTNETSEPQQSPPRRAHRRVFPFENLSDDTEEEEEDDDDVGYGRRNEEDSEDSEDDSPPEKWARPQHRWNALKAIRQREFGTARKSQERFRYKFMGSQRLVEKLEPLHRMENHSGCVNCLSFNSSGTRLASGSDDTNVTIWDWTRNKPLISFDTGHRLNVFQAKFMPLSGDCHIITCARDGQVRLAELSVRGVCKSTRKLAQHRGSAHKVALELDSPHTILTCGEDAVVFEIDIRDPVPSKLLTCNRLEGNRGKVALYSVHSNPVNPNHFVISGREPWCRVYDKRMIRAQAPDQGIYRKYCPHHLIDADWKPNVTAVVYNYNGTELLATYNDDDLYTFDTRHSDGADYLHRYAGHRNNATVKGVNYFGASSEFIVSGSDCGYIYVWERESEKIVNFFHGDEGGVVNVLEPHPSAMVLATSGLDHDVKIWMPTADDPEFDVSKLKSLVKKNQKLRSKDRSSVMNDPDYDSEMFFMIMSRMMRQMPRGRGRGAGNRDSDSEDESEESESETREAPLHCRPS